MLIAELETTAPASNIANPACNMLADMNGRWAYNAHVLMAEFWRLLRQAILTCIVRITKALLSKNAASAASVLSATKASKIATLWASAYVLLASSI